MSTELNKEGEQTHSAWTTALQSDLGGKHLNNTTNQPILSGRYHHRFTLLSVMTMITIFILSTLSVASAVSHKHSPGAIVALIKGKTKRDFNALVDRNKSIMWYMWQNETGAYNPDIVLFWDGEPISTEMQTYIQQQTPELVIKYIEIQFTGFTKYTDHTNTTAKQIYPACVPTWTSSTFDKNPGYRNMCRFWFMGMFEYLKEYDWMLRLDDDTELISDVRGLIPARIGAYLSTHNSTTGTTSTATTSITHTTTSTTTTTTSSSTTTNTHTTPINTNTNTNTHAWSHLSVLAPAWQPLHQQKFDRINTQVDGSVVTGLGAFTREFAARNGLNHTKIDSMYAPYTNCMFLNLRWLRSAHSTTGSSGGSSGISVNNIHSGGVSSVHSGSVSSVHSLNNIHSGVHSGVHLAHTHSSHTRLSNTGIDSSSSSSSRNNNEDTTTAARSQHDTAAIQAAIVLKFMREVDESNCIYTNRWGDMPLWGAALALIDQPVLYLPLPYYHASHNVIIKVNSQSGRFRNDIPYMNVFADSMQGPVVNTRITVER